MRSNATVLHPKVCSESVMNDEQLMRYARHILLDEFGIEGQEKLLGSRVLIVGAGGLGSPAALYLASAGVGHIVLADDDVVDVSNLQRQILHTTARVDQPKATSGQQTLEAINPHIRIEPLVQRLDGGDPRRARPDHAYLHRAGR